MVGPDGGGGGGVGGFFFFFSPPPPPSGPTIFVYLQYRLYLYSIFAKNDTSRGRRVVKLSLFLRWPQFFLPSFSHFPIHLVSFARFKGVFHKIKKTVLFTVTAT